MRRLLIILSVILIASSVSAGPLKVWKIDGEGKPVETACDTASNCDTSVSPFELSQSVKDAVDDIADADLIYITGTIYTVYAGGPPYSIAFYTDVHDYYRTQNADIYLIPYGNIRNHAGNIFHKTQVSDADEGYYLHIPLATETEGTRLVPAWWTPQDVCDEGTHNEWVYYMGDSNFVDFFTGEMATVLADGYKLDGIFLDNAGLENKIWKTNRCSDGVEDTPLNPGTTNDYTEAEQHTEHDDFIDEIVTDLTASNPDGNWNDADILLPINIGDCLVADEKTMIAALTAGDDILGGGLTEGSGWFAHDGGGFRGCLSDTEANDYVTDTRQYTVAEWKHQVDALKWLMDNNHMAMILAKRMVEDYNSSGTVNDEDWIAYPNSKLLFIYGSVLLAAGASGDECYFKYGPGNTMADWEGLDQDIGTADGAYDKWSGSTNIYYRWYTDGLVLVNPSDTPETVSVNIKYQRFVDGTINSLDWTGLGTAATADIEVDAYSAEILKGHSDPPTLSGLLPASSPNLACTTDPRNVTLEVTSDENATAKYDTSDVAYDSMGDTFTTTGGLSHAETKSLACDATYTYYVRSEDTFGNQNGSSGTITFTIDAGQPPPVVPGAGPSLTGVQITGGGLN